MNWTLHIVTRVRKSLKRIPRRDQAYIIEALKNLSYDPLGGDIQWLKNQPVAFRRRVGNWRILFDIDFSRRLIIVQDIKRRGSKTY